MKPELVHPTRSMARSGALLILVCVIGTVGYRIIGGDEHGWLDALYMTVVTLTTVGFREVIDLAHSPAGQAFTIVLLLLGVASFLYFFSNLMAFMVEGTLDHMFWRRRMTRKIARMKNHYIVCGGGRTGAYVIKELLATDREFVLIEESKERVEWLTDHFGTEIPVVIGDATSDSNLRGAGLENARGIVSCISSDKDNLVVAFSARDLRPDIRIVCRCTGDAGHAKLRKAGADAVVTPAQIGGLRLVSELVRPTVVTFLDRMLREGNDLRIEEVSVNPGSDLEGKDLAALEAEDIPDLMIVALRTPAGDWHYNPSKSAELAAGTGMVFIGSPSARAKIERAASATDAPRL